MSAWKTRRRDWLRGEGDWPLALPIGRVRESEVIAQWSAFDQWLRAWRDLVTQGRVQRELSPDWRRVGEQLLPVAWVFDTPEQVADELGEGWRWRLARERFERLSAWVDEYDAAARWQAALARSFDDLADLTALDFERLCLVLAWLREHPASGLYPRQLPIAGVDSKWLEARDSLVAAWLVALRGDPAQGFHAITGLRAMPDRLRLRLLDPSLRACFQGLGDIEAPLDELAVLDGFRPACVVIVENLTTGLAFDDLPDTVVCMRRGYAVEALAMLPWLAQAPRLLYWGDLDTHGLAILSRLRSHLPQARSVMMDTLDAFIDFAELMVDEPTPSAASSLPGLSEAEQAIYQRLKQGPASGDTLDIRGKRLEQERIAWDWAWQRLLAARHAP